MMVLVIINLRCSQLGVSPVGEEHDLLGVVELHLRVLQPHLIQK